MRAEAGLGVLHRVGHIDRLVGLLLTGIVHQRERDAQKPILPDRLHVDVVVIDLPGHILVRLGELPDRLLGWKMEGQRPGFALVGIAEHRLNDRRLTPNEGVVGKRGADIVVIADHRIPGGERDIVRLEGGRVHEIVHVAVISVGTEIHDDLVLLVEIPVGIRPNLEMIHAAVTGIELCTADIQIRRVLAVPDHGQLGAGLIIDGVLRAAADIVTVVFHCGVEIDHRLSVPHQIIRNLHIRHQHAAVGVLLPGADFGVIFGFGVSVGGGVDHEKASSLALVGIVGRGKNVDLLSLGKLQLQRTVELGDYFTGDLLLRDQGINLNFVACQGAGVGSHVHVIVAHHVDDVDGRLGLVADHGVGVVHGDDAVSALHLLHHPFVAGAAGFFVHPVDAVSGDEVVAAVEIPPVGDHACEIYLSRGDVGDVDHAVDVHPDVAAQILRIEAVGAVASHHQPLVRRGVRIRLPVGGLVGGDDAVGADLVLAEIRVAAHLGRPGLAAGDPVVRVGGDSADEALETVDLRAVLLLQIGGCISHGAVVLSARRHGGAVEHLALLRGIARHDGAHGLALIHIHHHGHHVGTPHTLALRQRAVSNDGADVDLVPIVRVAAVRLVGDHHELRDGAGLPLRQGDLVIALVEEAGVGVLPLIVDVRPHAVGADAKQHVVGLGGDHLDLGVGVDVIIQRFGRGIALQLLRVLQNEVFVVLLPVIHEGGHHLLRAGGQIHILKFHVLHRLGHQLSGGPVAVVDSLRALEAVQIDLPGIEQQIILDPHAVKDVDEGVRVLHQGGAALSEDRCDVHVRVAGGTGAQYALHAHTAEYREAHDHLDPAAQVVAAVVGIFPLGVFGLAHRRLVHVEAHVQRGLDGDPRLKADVGRDHHRPRGEEEILRDAAGKAAAEQDAAGAVVVLGLGVVVGAEEHREAHGKVVGFIGNALDFVRRVQDLRAALHLLGVFPEASLKDLEGGFGGIQVLGVPGFLEQGAVFRLHLRRQLRDVVGGHEDHAAVGEKAHGDRHLEHLEGAVEHAVAAHLVRQIAGGGLGGDGHFGFVGAQLVEHRVFHGEVLQREGIAAHLDGHLVAVLQQARLLLHPALFGGVYSGVAVIGIAGGAADGKDGLSAIGGLDLHGAGEAGAAGLCDQHLQREIFRVDVHKGEGRLLVHQILAGEVDAADVQIVLFRRLQHIGILLPCAHLLIQHRARPIALRLDIHDAEEGVRDVVKHGDAGGISRRGHRAFRDALAGVVEIGDRHERIRNARAVRVLHHKAHGVLVHDIDPRAGVGVRAEQLHLFFLVGLEANFGAHEEISALQIGLQTAVFHKVVGAL